MDALIELLSKTLSQVWTTIQHNWPFLIVSILVAVLLKIYLDPNKVSAFLLRHRKAGVIGATAAAVTTPLCSCGTTAIVLGMLATTMPWAPIVAFMVASPLTSPEELVYSAGLFGWPFALTFFTASIILGLAGGWAAGVFENRGWLKNQTRYTETPKTATNPIVDRRAAAQTCSCCTLIAEPVQVLAVSANGACGCGEAAFQPSFAATANACTCSTTALIRAVENQSCGCESRSDSGACACGNSADSGGTANLTPKLFLAEAFQTAKRLIPMFIGFAFIGYLLNNLIPAAWVSAIFGKGNVYSVPLAATLGLPLYINTEASLPLVRALIDGGMSQGAALAFMITGAGTSVGAVMGALTIARWRVIGLVIATLWVGAVLVGFLYDFILAAGLL